MARNRKPRKAYRPRPVLLDALTRLQPASADHRQAVLMKFHTALDAMARGAHPGPSEWRDMADAINTIEALTQTMDLLQPSATMPTVDAAKEAMVAAERRYRHTGRAGVDGPGLQALRDALGMYQQCATGFTQHAMAQARDIVQEQTDAQMGGRGRTGDGVQVVAL